MRGREQTRIAGSRLVNEFEFAACFSLVGNLIYMLRHLVSASNSSLATDRRLAQPMTPETVYSPTLAGRRSKPRNLILCLARAGSNPTIPSTAVQRLTTVPTRHAM